MSDKPLQWVGGSLAELRAFPADARRRAGYQLRRLQQGLLPDDWKPMGTVGAGVAEIRLHAGTEHRVFYVAKFDGHLCAPRLREADPTAAAGGH